MAAELGGGCAVVLVPFGGREPWRAASLAAIAGPRRPTIGSWTGRGLGSRPRHASENTVTYEASEGGPEKIPLFTRFLKGCLRKYRYLRGV